MVESARQVKSTAVEIDGLDDVFEADCEPIENSANTVPVTFDQGANHPAWQGVGMSLKAASIHYKLALSTLRMKIKRGEIAAKKIDGSNGPEWRVFPISSEFFDPINHRVNQGITQGADTVQAGYQGTLANDVNRLLNLIEKQSAKLEAAAGQVGYFKAQLDSYQEQVKLLPDLQAQAAKTSIQEAHAKELESELEQIKAHWWYRFWSWFTGR
jgi:hypothetical protein